MDQNIDEMSTIGELLVEKTKEATLYKILSIIEESKDKAEIKEKVEALLSK